jgi:hypothetical protein
MAALTLVLALATALWFRFGYVHPAPAHLQTRIRGGFAIFLVLTGLTGHAWFQESRAAEDVAQYVPPYPGIDGAVFVPPLPHEPRRIWIFRTDDGVAQVQDYYESEAVLEGWQVASAFPYLKLVRDDLEVCISAAPSGGRTAIVYEVQPRGAE